MPSSEKYNRILDAFQELLDKKNIQTISVSEIAQTAGIPSSVVVLGKFRRFYFSTLFICSPDPRFFPYL